RRAEHTFPDAHRFEHVWPDNTLRAKDDAEQREVTQHQRERRARPPSGLRSLVLKNRRCAVRHQMIDVPVVSRVSNPCYFMPMPSSSIQTHGELEPGLEQEWLLTNGTGSFASGTVVGCNTRRYHGLLCAATQPPVGRVMMLNRIGEIVKL